MNPAQAKGLISELRNIGDSRDRPAARALNELFFRPSKDELVAMGVLPPEEPPMAPGMDPSQMMGGEQPGATPTPEQGGPQQPGQPPAGQPQPPGGGAQQPGAQPPAPAAGAGAGAAPKPKQQAQPKAPGA